MAECPKCRWINRDDAQKCANCAADLRIPQPQQPYQPPQQTQQYRPPQQQPTIQGGQGYPQQSYTPQGRQGYQQGQYQYGQQGYERYAQSVPDNLVWSILVTLFCCQIPGIVSLVKAVEANSKKAAGDYYGAMAAYNDSRTWMYWAIGLGVAQQIGVLVYVILSIVGAVGAGAFM